MYLPRFVGLVYTAALLSFTVLPVSLFPVYQSFVSENCDTERNGVWSLYFPIPDQTHIGVYCVVWKETQNIVNGNWYYYRG